MVSNDRQRLPWRSCWFQYENYRLPETSLSLWNRSREEQALETTFWRFAHSRTRIRWNTIKRNVWWGCAAGISRQTLTVFQTKMCNFRLALKFIPFFRLASRIHTRVCKVHTRFHTFRPKWLKYISYFWPKRLKNHTLWRCTYLFGLIGLDKGSNPVVRGGDRKSVV